MKSEKFDICIIGGGPGGYVAAIRASQLGASVALIEREHLGGVCLNVGCIPTKTLISSVEILRKVKDAESMGVKISGKINVDWDVMLDRKAKVIEKLRTGISSLLKAAGVKVFSGRGVFRDRRSVEVYNNDNSIISLISAEKGIIIATGSSPLIPSFIPANKRILTSTDLLSLKTIPDSLLVLGGGVIGCEFACLFAELGTKVTIVEMMNSIIPNQDKEIAKTLTKYMQDMGITVVTGKPLENIKADKNGVSGDTGDMRISAQYMLVAIGRKANSAGINLDGAGVKTDEKERIIVNKNMRTSVPGIYAIGDVTDTKWLLAHWASASGICAVENILGKRREINDKYTPGCIFTIPEIGTAGLTSEECKEKGIAVKTGKFPFAALGKALAMNETEGFCKIIADAETDQVLGIHIIGPHATDLIGEAAPALGLEITSEELGNAIHAHPTLGEIVMETAHAVQEKSIHIPVKKRKAKNCR